MKFRITPLNIIGAGSFVLFLFNVFKEKPKGQHFDLNGFYILLLVCLIVVTFITDLIFRFTLKDLKRIWVVELIFISIAIILMLILQKVA